VNERTETTTQEKTEQKDRRKEKERIANGIIIFREYPNGNDNDFIIYYEKYKERRKRERRAYVSVFEHILSALSQ